MGRGRVAQPVVVSGPEREVLEGLVRQSTAAQRDVLRARIALMVADGLSTIAIAAALGVSAQTVCLWRGRLAQAGVNGLKGVARSGRPRRIQNSTRLELLALACVPAEENGRATPTLDELLDKAINGNVIDRISRSHLHRILQAGDIRPHRVRQWLHSPDPAFREKVTAICALYHQAPAGAVVLSIDEKTGIQAIERKHLDRPPQPGRLRRREFEYIRHGTQTLIAALDVHTGKVVGTCRDRRTQADMVEFMETVAQVYADQPVHVVWDNLNTHTAKAVWEEFNTRHGQRFHFHFTPFHASWVNQVELLFGIYSRRVLRHASHTSTVHLRERTETFLEQRNDAPRPFRWSFKGYPLQAEETEKRSDAKPNRCP
jgi:transposase